MLSMISNPKLKVQKVGALVIIASFLVIGWRELVHTRGVKQPGTWGKPDERLVLLQKPR